MTRPRLVTDICPHCRVAVGTCEIRQLYDGVAYSQCPKCKRCWSRQGTPLKRGHLSKINRETIFTL